MMSYYIFEYQNSDCRDHFDAFGVVFRGRGDAMLCPQYHGACTIMEHAHVCLSLGFYDCERNLSFVHA
jgi:hypothetical protein